MKIFQVAKWGLREDDGKEVYASLFLTEKYSLFQLELLFDKTCKWSEPPYLQISMGYGKLFSFLFFCGKVSVTFDIAGRNWKDKTYYTQES